MKKTGFSLIELVFTILILAILGTISISHYQGADDAERYELTRRKMEAISNAILGAKDIGAGRQEHFGYHGDRGQMPAALTNLTTAQAPLWSFDTTYGVGAGWRGPYYKSDFTDSYPITQDFWGRNFVYDGVTLTSLGSDGLAGGSVYAADLVLTFSSSMRSSRVWGMVRDGASALSGRTVQLFYPAAGTLTSSSTNTNASGFFSFSNIPFGVRAIRITTVPVKGPKTVSVDSAETLIPPDTFDYLGTLKKVTVSQATAGCSATGRRHTVSVASQHTSAVTLSNMTFWWQDATRRLQTVILDSVTENVGTVSSGTTITPAASLSIPAGATKTLELRFNKKADQMRIVGDLSWTGVANHDSISWITQNCANPPIAVNNAQGAKDNSNTSSVTLNYTVTNALSDHTLVVFSGAEDTTANVIPTGATFGAAPMNLMSAFASSGAGSRVGGGMFWLPVANNANGTITVTYPGKCNNHTIEAFTLNSTDGKGPEVTATSFNNGGATSTNITPLTDDGMVATGAYIGVSEAMNPIDTSTGHDHIEDLTHQPNSSAGAMGHLSFGIPSPIKSVGYTSASTNRMVLIMGSFVYLP